MKALDIKFSGLRENRGRLRRIARGLRKESGESVKANAILAKEYAKNIAPIYHGNVRDAIIISSQNQYKATVMSMPSPADGFFPVNVAFETGDFSRMKMWGRPKYLNGEINWVPFKPRRTSSIHFMSKTARFIEQEFSKDMQRRVKTVIGG